VLPAAAASAECQGAAERFLQHTMSKPSFATLPPLDALLGKNIFLSFYVLGLWNSSHKGSENTKLK